MTKKQSIRIKDRKKLNKYQEAIFNHYSSVFNSKPFCNRCRKIFDLEDLEINHITYANQDYRVAELVCRRCHEDIDFKKVLSKFEKNKTNFPQTILIFKKNFPSLSILSKLVNGEIIYSGRAGVQPNSALSLSPLLSILN